VGDDWQFDHVGMLVRDADKTAEHFASLGFVSAGAPGRFTWNGSSAPTVLKERVLRKDAFGLLLQEPLEGAGVPTEFMQKHGEGIYYLAFAVDDLPAKASTMVEKGFPILSSVKGDDGKLAATYHDTRQVVDLIIALVDSSSVAAADKAGEASWRLEHVGVIVGDIHKAREFYESLGFEVIVPAVALFFQEPLQRILTECLLIRNDFVIELMAPFGDENLWARFLQEHGGGINHLSFAVEDLDADNDRMVAKGFEVTSIARESDGSLKEVYYDTSAYGNVQTCLYKGEPRFKYEDTMKYLVDIGLLLGRGDF
jgi:catechol 2,3-dioxygenase-like lactoylglutathione lyase family enzyme